MQLHLRKQREARQPIRCQQWRTYVYELGAASSYLPSRRDVRRPVGADHCTRSKRSQSTSADLVSYPAPVAPDASLWPQRGQQSLGSTAVGQSSCAAAPRSFRRLRAVCASRQVAAFTFQSQQPRQRTLVGNWVRFELEGYGPLAGCVGIGKAIAMRPGKEDGAHTVRVIMWNRDPGSD